MKFESIKEEDYSIVNIQSMILLSLDDKHSLINKNIITALDEVVEEVLYLSHLKQ